EVAGRLGVEAYQADHRPAEGETHGVGEGPARKRQSHRADVLYSQALTARRFPPCTGGIMISRTLALPLFVSALTVPLAADRSLPPTKIDPRPKPLASDPSVKIDYDIVYVRAPRFVPGRNGKPRPSAWPEIAHPTNIDPGYDLMLLHPDGKEELL